MSANARTPIDPTDSSIQLIDVLKTKHDFREEVKLKSFQDEKREIVYVGPVVWLMFNGYPPRDHKWTRVNGVPWLQGWKRGHLNTYSRFL